MKYEAIIYQKHGAVARLITPTALQKRAISLDDRGNGPRFRRRQWRRRRTCDHPRSGWRDVLFRARYRNLGRESGHAATSAPITIIVLDDSARVFLPCSYSNEVAALIR